MITVLVMMVLGMVIGYILKEKKNLIKLFDKITLFIIHLLLFILGIGVGLNKTIILNIESIGVQALVITIGALLGSLILAFFTYQLFFKSAKNQSHEK
jgi:uncharacterized membrane protein YbjE (DUF340 family)